MIFISVGTSPKGFDSFVREVDEWCGKSKRPYKVEGQIGNSSYKPINYCWERFYDEDKMKNLMSRAKLVLCHAGVGIVGDVLRSKTDLIIVPRIEKIGRNNPGNSQSDFAKRLNTEFGITVCWDLEELGELLESKLSDINKAGERSLVQSNIPNLIQEFLAQTV